MLAAFAAHSGPSRWRILEAEQSELTRLPSTVLYTLNTHSKHHTVEFMHPNTPRKQEANSHSFVHRPRRNIEVLPVRDCS